MSPLIKLVEKIRLDRPQSDWVPDFDPEGGTENAKFLIILEAPGPKADKYVSCENKDPTAKNLKEQLVFNCIS
jgi:hypothetical protein